MADEPVTPEASGAQINEAVKEVKAGAAATPAEQVEVVLSTGQKYHAANEQELRGQLVQAQEHASTKITEQKAEIDQIKQQLADLQAPQGDESQFDATTYYQLWGQDPLKADEYKARFDPQAQEMRVVMARQQADQQMNTFKANTGFYPTSREQAGVFADAFAATGLAPTAENLELVYHRALRDNRIQLPAARATVGGRKPPVSLEGGGGASGTGAAGVNLEEFENMRPEQQAEVIRKLEAQGVK